MTTQAFAVLGAGVWAPGIEGFDALASGLAAPGFEPLAQAYVPPKPEAIAPRERRRTGGLINLAVQVAHEGCERAGVDKSAVPSVFTSAMSDTALTDYMCRKLTAADKLLSPTKFHNSVHNAPSGYWSISANNRAPSSYVGGFLQSVGVGLLEAVSQSEACGGPVLLAAYDIANEAPFHDIAAVGASLGVALVIQKTDGEAAVSVKAPLAATLEVEAGEGEDAAAVRHPGLAALAAANPVGGALVFAEALAEALADVRTDASAGAADGATCLSDRAFTLGISPSARIRISVKRP